jgi:protein tyrosine phosphatase domain-containing protein 1
MQIGLIVNLQRQGEHPYCGPNKGLEEISGFTYNPEAFTTEGVRVRLSGWKDMHVPDSVNFMLEIVKDMAIAIKEEKKKVLVHCHAGYGRTGIVLACYMIFDSTKSAEQCVSEIREIRPQCVQKSSQMEYCRRFNECILFYYFFANIRYFKSKGNIHIFKKGIRLFYKKPD